MHTWFWSDGLKEKGNVEDLGVDERIKGLLKWILKKCDRGMEGMDRIHLTQVCDRGMEAMDWVHLTHECDRGMEGIDWVHLTQKRHK